MKFSSKSRRLAVALAVTAAAATAGAGAGTASAQPSFCVPTPGGGCIDIPDPGAQLSAFADDDGDGVLNTPRAAR